MPRRKSKALPIGLSLALVVVIGLVDFATGSELRVSAFYLLPILPAAWIAGRSAGMWIALACALTWLVCELASGTKYQQPATLYWNALMLFGLFLPTPWLVAAFRESREALDRKVDERTASLRDSEGRLKAVVETAVEGIITIDSRGRVESMNPAAERIFGYHAEEVIGRNVNMLMPAPYHKEHDGYISRYLETGEAKIIGFGREVEGRRKDGTVFPMDLSVSEFALGGERKFVGLVRDITERKRLEAAVAAAAEEERGRIARDIHDGLGQQLGGALFLSDLLRRDLKERGAVEGPRAAEVHALVVKALAQARELSHGLYPVPAEADGLMTALQNLADRVARDRQIECTFDADSAVLLSDRAMATHLYRIAQEAVSNSLKHSGAKRIEIKLTSTARSLELSVRDYGAGLPADARTRGLGMQTMHDRASLIGGQLMVQNAVDGGVLLICSFSKSRAKSGIAESKSQANQQT